LIRVFIEVNSSNRFVSSGTLMIAGRAWLTILSFEKLGSPLSGFINPFSFIATVLLVLGGFQITTFGLRSRLMLQMRQDVTSSMHLDETNYLPVRYAYKENDSDRD